MKLRAWFVSVLFASECLLTICAVWGATTVPLTNGMSPNGKLLVIPYADGLQVLYQGTPVLRIPVMKADAATTEKNGSLRFAERLTVDYQMLSGKRLHAMNEANVYRVAMGPKASLVFRLYNDGIAFRYEYTGLSGNHCPQEQTIYRIPEGTRRWMQQWTDSYEGFFPLSTTYKVKPVPSFPDH